MRKFATMSMRRIFLIGYMGCGKTSIGKQLAKKLDLSFVDLDAFIENRHHKSVRSLFEERGEAAFRQIEKQALEEVAQFEDTVVSTGGGTPCFFNNLEVMNLSGTSIYLEVSINELASRLLSAKDKRPLLKDKDEEELISFITDSLSKRKQFYEQATHTYRAELLTSKKDIDTTVDHIVSLLPGFTS